MADTAFQPDWFSKPGDTVSLLMDKQNFSPAMLAERVGSSIALIQGLLAGTAAIDDKVAQLLALHLGGSATFWATRQAQFDRCLDRVADAVPADHARSWLKLLPIREMTNSGWLPEANDGRAVVKASLAFFGVSGPAEWKERYESIHKIFSFRTSAAYETKVGPLSAWLRRGEIEASGLPCAPWDPGRFRTSLSEIRALTNAKNPAYFIPRLRAACAKAGVAVVFVRAPSGCRASGAARFISSQKAMMILSFRYLSDDHFWFSFFHEAGHLSLHGTTSTFIDGESSERDEMEEEANRFSAAVLVPPDRSQELMELPARSKSVIRFATNIGISPGIVVGQMQHNLVIGPNQLNHLKRRYGWDQITEAVSL